MTCGDLGDRADGSETQQERAAEGDGRRGCNGIDLGSMAVAIDVPDLSG